MKINIARSIASVAVCYAGAYSMYLTHGETGIGWACLGLFFIWYFDHGE